MTSMLPTDTVSNWCNWSNKLKSKVILFSPSELCWLSVSMRKRMPLNRQLKTWRFRSKGSSSPLKTSSSKLRRSTRWLNNSWKTRISPMLSSTNSYTILEARFTSTVDTMTWPRWQSNWRPITTRPGPEPVWRTCPTCSREMSMIWRLVRVWSTSSNNYWPMTYLIKIILKSSTCWNRSSTCPDSKSMWWLTKLWISNRMNSSDSETKRTISNLWSPSTKSVQREWVTFNWLVKRSWIWKTSLNQSKSSRLKSNHQKWNQLTSLQYQFLTEEPDKSRRTGIKSPNKID